MRFLALVGLISLLTACVTAIVPIQPSTTQLTLKDREATLTRIRSWQVSGKMGVQTANDAGSATVSWAERNGQYHIALYGPLGAGGLKLIGQPGHVTLETPDGKRFTANSPEQLLAQQWGWHLPISYLMYWIRGLPVPGVPYDSQFDSQHRLTALTQQGWHVQFLSYTSIDNIDLPSRISITGASLKSKIVIHQWRLR